MNESALSMWNDFLEAIDAADVKPTSAPGREHTPGAWAFGLGEAMETELAELVVAGVKRATATSAESLRHSGEHPPQPGDYSVIYDGARRARCIIRTQSVHTAPLSSVTDRFAWREGEGDRSRDYWIEGHRRFFRAEHEELGIPYSDDIAVVFEEFVVVWPPHLADEGITTDP